MPSPTLTAAVRRFPLLGRPRPECPALPLRIQEIADAVDAARHKAEHGLSDAAHALNKAALIASDSGMTDLARHLCWQHIDTYRRVGRPLTVLEARHLLEPVLNLARLQIRTDQRTAALHLLESMFQAVTRHEDLLVEDQTLPLAHLTGDQQDRRQLRQWVWLQLVGEGVRALALAGRWKQAAGHARRYNGIGDHLMEGRQAEIIAHCVHGDLAKARVVLARSATTEPWEQDIASCLQMMSSEPSNELTVPTATVTTVAEAVVRYTGRARMTGYDSYHARLGLAIATLANTVSPGLTTVLLGQVAQDAIDSADGYAARDVLGFREPIAGITDDQRSHLSRLATQAGLGVGILPQPILQRLAASTDEAAAVLDSALATGGVTSMRARPRKMR
jgi:hypothetical protein